MPRALLLLPFVASATALTCYSTQNGTCTGDVCTASVLFSSGREFWTQNCAYGPHFSRLAGKALEDKDYADYFCDTDYCNVDSSDAHEPKKVANLSCDEVSTAKCMRCSTQLRTREGGIHERRTGCHERSAFTEILTLFAPSSWCLHFQYFVGTKFTQCGCEEESMCSERLLMEQRWPSEGPVECAVYASTNESFPSATCRGQACFLLHSPAFGRPRMGCIYNNETLSPGLIQEGHSFYRNNIAYYFCKGNRCNVDVASAREAVGCGEGRNESCHEGKWDGSHGQTNSKNKSFGGRIRSLLPSFF